MIIEEWEDILPNKPETPGKPSSNQEADPKPGCRRLIFIQADDPEHLAAANHKKVPQTQPQAGSGTVKPAEDSVCDNLRTSLIAEQNGAQLQDNSHPQKPSVRDLSNHQNPAKEESAIHPDPSGNSQSASQEQPAAHAQLRQDEPVQAAASSQEPGIDRMGKSSGWGQGALQVKQITAEEYAQFAADKDIVPLAGPGLYERMKSKGEDVRIYGGFDQGRMQIAMICRKTPALRLFSWMEAPFGPVMLNPLDTRLLVQFIQGIEDLEDSDSLLYLRMESFLEYQNHQQDGQADPESFNNKAWRQEMERLHVQPMPLSTGFEPGRQARFAGRIDLARDESLYNGVPISSAYINQRSSMPMRSRRDLFEKMAPAMQEKIMQAQQSFIRVRLLAQNELDLAADLQKQASEPFDETFLENYGHDSAMVLVSLDVEEYVQYMKDGYDEVSMELQSAFAKAKQHPQQPAMQKLLLESIGRMQVWDQEMERVEQLETCRLAEVPLAAGLYLFNPVETLCLWQASNPSFDHLPGMEAMHWFMLDWSRSRHAFRYTIWGLLGNTHPQEEGYDAFAFVRDFGGRLAEFTGAFVAPFKPGSTRAYQAYLKSRNLQ